MFEFLTLSYVWTDFYFFVDFGPGAKNEIQVNRLFLSPGNPHFQSEAKLKTFLSGYNDLHLHENEKLFSFQWLRT